MNNLNRCHFKMKRKKKRKNLTIGDDPQVIRGLGETACTSPPSNRTAVSSSLSDSLTRSTKLTSECLLVQRTTPLPQQKPKVKTN